MARRPATAGALSVPQLPIAARQCRAPRLDIVLTLGLRGAQKVGDRIACNIGEWALGTVIKCWYR